MHNNEVLEITYDVDSYKGLIRLDCTAEQFPELLRKVEQTLADTHVKNILYTRRSQKEDDFAEGEPLYQQQSFFQD